MSTIFEIFKFLKSCEMLSCSEKVIMLIAFFCNFNSSNNKLDVFIFAQKKFTKLNPRRHKPNKVTRRHNIKGEGVKQTVNPIN